MKQLIADYKALTGEISDEVKVGILTDKSEIQILRAEAPVFRDYRPIVDWYYDAYAMKEEFETPFEEMYMKEDYSAKEWKEMKEDYAAYKKQYEAEKDKLEVSTVKAVLTELRQMVKLLG